MIAPESGVASFSDNKTQRKHPTMCFEHFCGFYKFEVLQQRGVWCSFQQRIRHKGNQKKHLKRNSVPGWRRSCSSLVAWRNEHYCVRINSCPISFANIFKIDKDWSPVLFLYCWKVKCTFLLILWPKRVPSFYVIYCKINTKRNKHYGQS